MMCWPGGCGTVMLAAERGESGGTGGGIYMQWMVDLNTESGFRKAFKVSLDQVYRSTGSKFADKPHAVYMLDEDNPGTVPVALEVEMPDGSIQTIERQWPKARILVVFALFNPSKIDIEILSMHTDDYGASDILAPYLYPENYSRNMGRTYKDIIQISNLEPLTKESYEHLRETAPFTPIMFYNALEEDVVKGLEHPSSVVGSDGYIWTDRETGEMAYDWDSSYDKVNGHPRGAGTHARVLARTREKKLDIPLSLAVSKMTYMIAKYMEDNGVPQMADKGRIQEGKDADITIFDPETVQDNATMQDGGLPSTGIPYVLVNGTVVVKDSATVDDVFPGKPIHGTGKPA